MSRYLALCRPPATHRLRHAYLGGITVKCLIRQWRQPRRFLLFGGRGSLSAQEEGKPEVFS